jgi:anti-anti-sigma factor
MQLEIDRSELEAGVLLLTLSGPMTTTSQVQRLEWLVEELAGNGQNRIVLDMAQISHVDSSAIGVLVGAHLLMKDSGGQLRLAAVADRVRMVFKIAGVESVLCVDKTTEDALAALHPKA